MVDEVREVQTYIAGDSLNSNNLYRMLYLMVCWYKQQELDRLQIRETIFDWGNKNGIYIKYKVNDILNRVFDSKIDTTLKSPVVYINQQDINEINRRFDCDKVKFVALAMLCYAKAHADSNNEFTISSISLGDWTKMERKRLSSKFIKELVDFDYLSIVSKPKNNYKWENVYNNQSTRYRVNTELINDGEYKLEENNLVKLFEKIFSTQ